MRSVIKPEYQSTWFAIPKTLVEAYMPTIGIRPFMVYAILSCYQDENGKIKNALPRLSEKTEFRNMKLLHTLDYLKRMRLLQDYFEDNQRTIELSFKPQPKLSKKRTYER